MITLHNVEETSRFAQIIGEVAQAGDNLVLTGDLGAGKTTLTKGIAAGLAIEQLIKSPTYTLIREYDEGRLPLYHMDVYRLEDGSGIDLGLDEYFEGDGVCIVEWGNLLGEALPEDYLELILTKDVSDESLRQVNFQAHGEAGAAFLARILSASQHS